MTQTFQDHEVHSKVLRNFQVLFETHRLISKATQAIENQWAYFKYSMGKLMA
jgi:hypothetical protein